MTHEEAVETLAVEAYLLGDLNDAEREEFELHMFGCPACSREVVSTTTLLGALKKSFEGDPKHDPRFTTEHAAVAYVLGDLLDEDRQAFEIHLEHCQSCVSHVEVGVKILVNLRRALEGQIEPGKRRVFALQFSRWFDLVFRDLNGSEYGLYS